MNSLAGRKIGKLLVIGRNFRQKNTKRCYWMCICTCGKRCIKRSDYFTNLYRNKSKASCGCERIRLLSKRNSKASLRPYEALFNLFRTHTKHRTNSVSYKRFLNFTKIRTCHYCGSMVFWQKYGTRNGRQGYNLDRKDSAKGYSFGNCVVCCKRCNTGKGNLFTYEEWKKIGDLIRSWKK